jgi:uncharacterized protein
LEEWSIEENYRNIQVPALTIAAWYDLFQDGSLRNYLGLKAHAENQADGNGQHLPIAIGGHSGWSRRWVMSRCERWNAQGSHPSTKSQMS